MKITVDAKIESQNVYQNWHWVRRGQYKSGWYWRILSALNAARIRRPAVPPQKKVRVKITSYRKQLIDLGNLIGGSKPIPDCLVQMRFLKDDGPKWCDIAYEQFIDRENPRTTIEVFE